MPVPFYLELMEPVYESAVYDCSFMKHPNVNDLS